MASNLLYLEYDRVAIFLPLSGHSNERTPMKTDLQPTPASAIPKDPSHLNLNKGDARGYGDSFDEATQSYWDTFYGKQKTQSPPSQFAAFIASEYKNHSLFIDIGCGNGRDTLFFSYLGHDVIGIDKSSSAIDFCNSQMISSNEKLSAFMRGDVSELDLNHPLFKAITTRKKLIYSRFFLHAIQEQKEDELFEFITQICQHPEYVIALEFRTKEDEYNPKEAKAHFRRFISPAELQLKLETQFKLRIDYQVQGYGLAKYGSEDAHVCRMLASFKP